MQKSTRSRRFLPSLDLLPHRITPTDMCLSPMDPSVLGWCPPPSDVSDAVSPMEPMVVGWTPPEITMP